MENKKTALGLDENVAGFLCYVATWITGIIFLILEKENKFVRFHAMQSLLTFLILSAISIFIGWVPIIGWIISILMFPLWLILWIVLMVKAFNGEKFKLPIVGNIAEKQVNK